MVSDSDRSPPWYLRPTLFAGVGVGGSIAYGILHALSVFRGIEWRAREPLVVLVALWPLSVWALTVALYHRHRGRSVPRGALWLSAFGVVLPGLVTVVALVLLVALWKHP